MRRLEFDPVRAHRDGSQPTLRVADGGEDLIEYGAPALDRQEQAGQKSRE